MIQVDGWAILNGFGGGVLAYLVFQGILSLKCYRLQSAIGALQQQMLTVRTQGYVQKRWNKRDELEAEISQFKQSPPASRFDNDPFIPEIQQRR